MRSTVVAALGVLGVGSIVAMSSCAKGNSETGFETESSSVGGTTQHHHHHATTGTVNPSTGAASTESGGVGGFGSSSSGAGVGGFGGSTGSQSTSSGTGGGSTCDYSSPVTCSGATKLKRLNGDDTSSSPAGPRIETGTTSMFYEIEIYEDSNLPTPLSYTVTLINPSGMQFDAFIYESSTKLPDCGVSPSQATGAPATYHSSWGDTWGTDDSREVVVEVRYVSGGTCGSNAQWTLKVEGDT